MYKSGRVRQLQRILPAAVLLTLTVLIASACSPKIVRTPVPMQDILKANKLSQEGDKFFEKKYYYAALIKYLQATQLNPYNEYIVNRVGITFSQLKFYDEAREAFDRALALNPKFSYAVNNLGSVYFAQKNFGKAEKHFKKAIKLKKDEASFYLNLGSVYLEKKKSDKAIATWRRALALDKNIFFQNSAVSLTSDGRSSPMERSYFIARLYASEGKVESAIASLKQAFNLGFSNVEEIDRQPDFNPIREDERFVEFINNLALLIRLRSNIGLATADAPIVPPPGKQQ
jgi:tetratricopeptide (TPR) repeat protein